MDLRRGCPPQYSVRSKTILSYSGAVVKYGPADKILDRKKGMDYVHRGAKGKGTCNV